jgi:hypothetical protein
MRPLTPAKSPKRWLLPENGESEDDDAAAREIEAIFRRKLMGLRRLPKRERAAALRAAREERQLALHALRQRRAMKRRGPGECRPQSLEPP